MMGKARFMKCWLREKAAFYLLPSVSFKDEGLRGRSLVARNQSCLMV